jgi:hypothetical protein
MLNIVRFEIVSAWIIGGLIPVLAVCLDYCRSGFSFSLAGFIGNLDDYLTGGLLIFAGWASTRARSFAPVFLVLAWAYSTSMMVDSSWGQIEDTLRGELDPYNTAVILGKLAVLSTCILSLMLSFRRAISASIMK